MADSSLNETRNVDIDITTCRGTIDQLIGYYLNWHISEFEQFLDFLHSML